MSYVPLAMAKAHLAVIHDADDDLIQQNLDAAEAYCVGYMNRQPLGEAQQRPWAIPAYVPRPLYPRCDPWVVSEPAVVSSEPSPGPVPKSVVQAVLLTVGDFYENRTASIIGLSIYTNPAVAALLDQHRIWTGV